MSHQEHFKMNQCRPTFDIMESIEKLGKPLNDDEPEVSEVWSRYNIGFKDSSTFHCGNRGF